MAQSLIIRNLCDVCLADGTETPEAETYEIAVTGTRGGPFTVELCAEHGRPLVEAVSTLAPYGRPPEKDTPAPARPASGRRRVRTGPDDDITCPVCGYAVLSLGAMRNHVRTEHNKSLAAVGLAEANFTCPGCGDPFPNRQGMAGHIRATHPDIKETA